MKDLLSLNNIELYSTQNEEKSCVIERFNRTFKEKIFKYFTAYDTNKYYDVLDQIVNEYNNTFHNTIKMSPQEGSKKVNQNKIFERVFQDSKEPSCKKSSSAKFKIGDRVRITKYKGKFEKGYTTNFTREIFVIDKILNTIPVTYKIKDQKGEEIIGSFYEQELQKTKF